MIYPCTGNKELQITITFWARSDGMVLEEFGWFGGICERKTRFRMKKEADQAGFKGTRTGPLSGIGLCGEEKK